MGTTGKTIKKEKFDTSAFVFETDLSTLEEKLLACYAELEDLLEYQQPDSEQRKRIEELKYWLGIWERDLPEAKRRGLTKVPLCAIEGRVFGTYEKKTKRGKK